MGRRKDIEEGMSVASALKQLRAERGIMQFELAQMLGVSATSISLWESGDRFPNKRMREKICDYFNVDMNFLTGYSSVHNSSLDESQVVCINLFDRGHLKEKIADSLTSANKDIFDTDYTISEMLLPKFMFRTNATYFAIEAREKGLEAQNVRVGDVLLFVQANANECENNTVVCVYIDGKVYVRLLKLGDNKYYYLARTPDDESSLKVPFDSDEIVVGKLVYTINKAV